MIELDKITNKAHVEGVGANLVLKEYIHLFVLDYLFKSGYFSHLVFQGGMALRFAYGGVRYSEDLDFVLKRKNSRFFSSLIGGMKDLTTYLDRLLPFAQNIQLKIQKDTVDFKRFSVILEIEMFKAKDKTHIEVVNIPSYDNQAVIIKREDIPVNPAIVVETPREILSDKFIALGARNYLKGRDIWDIYFLLDTLKVILDRHILTMAQKKIKDYHIGYKLFGIKFKDNIALLKERGGFILREEMEKFLPISYKKVFEKNYRDILKDVLNASLWFKDNLRQ